jgi:septum formation protein
MDKLGIAYEVKKADINEKLVGDRSSGTIDNAKTLVLEVAEAKMNGILANYANELHGRVLLCADQVVVCNNRILEKPSNELEAREFLRLYDSFPCSTVGSIILCDTSNGKRLYSVDVVNIYFKPFRRDVIDALIDEGIVYNCAGALMIEHPLVIPFISNIDGSLDSVMGLNPDHLLSMLQSLRGDLCKI